MKIFTRFSAFILFVFCLFSAGTVAAQAELTYYSKATGDLHNLATWGTNMDGSGANPPDFGGGLSQFSTRNFALNNRNGKYEMTGDWSVGGSLSFEPGSVLYVGNHTFFNNNLDPNAIFGGTRMSTIGVGTTSPGVQSLRFAPGFNDVNTLSVSYGGKLTGSFRLASALNVYGMVTGAGLGLVFDLGDSLTLKSTASGTARLASAVKVGSGTSPAVRYSAKRITVERYIPARRAWRLLCVPVGGSQTINEAWQEGVTTSSANPNPNPGYGTHITEGSAGDGWDHNPLGAAISIKSYNSETNSWVPLANTNKTAVNAAPYLAFIRGDRSVPLGTTAATPTATTLRATGPLLTDIVATSVNQGFTAVRNPFASPINFAKIGRGDVQNNFYVWDPKLGGEYGVGGWVLLSFNGSSYDVIPASVSPESQYIQSGQGFMVYANGPRPVISMIDYEVMQVGGSDNVFRVGDSAQGNGNRSQDAPMTPSPAGLRISLQTINADNTSAVVDEVLSSYGSGFSNKVDSMDAHKPSNVQENLAISRDGEVLMIERRQPLTESDGIQLKLWNTTVGKKYQLEVNTNSLNTALSTAYLSDSYLHTTTPIDLHQTTRMPFSVNADPASASPFRFSLAFKGEADGLNAKAGISMYPNPLRSKSVRLSFTNQPPGTYQVELLNGLGQVVYKSQINHAGGSAVQQVELPGKPAAGSYLLNIAGSSGKNSLKVVVD
ncbi:MAG: T9SS type A sorting domain-containing protein [Williamsia sp.]|nr:T9SS type A sorting domain-containing protein [Williamsia sp.]